MGLFDAIIGRRKIAGPGARPAVRDHDRLHHARDRAPDHARAASAAIVFQPLATGDFEQIAADMEDVLRGTGDGDRLDDRDQRRTASATAG